MAETFEHMDAAQTESGKLDWVMPAPETDMSRPENSNVFFEPRGGYGLPYALPEMNLYDEEALRFGLEKQDLDAVPNLVATQLQNAILDGDMNGLSKTVQDFSSDKDLMREAIQGINRVMIENKRNFALGMTEDGGLVMYRHRDSSALVIEPNGDAKTRILNNAHGGGTIHLGEELAAPTAQNLLENLSIQAKMLQSTNPYDSYYHRPRSDYYNNGRRPYYYGANPSVDVTETRPRRGYGANPSDEIFNVTESAPVESPTKRDERMQQLLDGARKNENIYRPLPFTVPPIARPSHSGF